jgi:hypothetical protein
LKKLITAIVVITFVFCSCNGKKTTELQAKISKGKSAIQTDSIALEKEMKNFKVVDGLIIPNERANLTRENRTDNVHRSQFKFSVMQEAGIIGYFDSKGNLFIEFNINGTYKSDQQRIIGFDYFKFQRDAGSNSMNAVESFIGATEFELDRNDSTPSGYSNIHSVSVFSSTADNVSNLDSYKIVKSKLYDFVLDVCDKVKKNPHQEIYITEGVTHIIYTLSQTDKKVLIELDNFQNCVRALENDQRQMKHDMQELSNLQQ